MTNALANSTGPEEQPRWVIALPEAFRTPLMELMAKQDPKDHKALQRAVDYISQDFLVSCQSAEEVLDLIKVTAESVATDDQTTYIPAVWTIDHKNQRWVDDQGNPLGDEIQGVIVFYMPTRAFFLEGRKQPICSAMGTWERGKAADDAQEAWSQYKLFNPAMPITWSGQEHECGKCPFNEFGSDPKTGDGMACKKKYREFFVPLGADGEFTGEGVMLNLPPTSVKTKDEFVSKLQRYKPAGKLKVEKKTVLQVVTGLALEKAEGQGQTYSKVNLKARRLLTYPEFQMMTALRKQIAAVADTIDIAHGESFEKAAGPQGGDGFKPEPDNNF